MKDHLAIISHPNLRTRSNHPPRQGLYRSPCLKQGQWAGTSQLQTNECTSSAGSQNPQDSNTVPEMNQQLRAERVKYGSTEPFPPSSTIDSTQFASCKPLWLPRLASSRAVCSTTQPNRIRRQPAQSPKGPKMRWRSTQRPRLASVSIADQSTTPEARLPRIASRRSRTLSVS